MARRVAGRRIWRVGGGCRVGCALAHRCREIVGGALKRTLRLQSRRLPILNCLGIWIGHAQLCSPEIERRVGVFHGRLGRSRFGLVGSRGRSVAQGGRGGEAQAALSNRCLGGFARSPACGLDLARGRPGFFNAIVGDQICVFAWDGGGAIARKPCETTGEGDLAAAILGASYKGRGGFFHSRSILLAEPRETWIGDDAGRMAIFVNTSRHSIGAGGA